MTCIACHEYEMWAIRLRAEEPLDTEEQAELLEWLTAQWKAHTELREVKSA